MKKTISAILVCVLLLGTMLTLVSCGKMLTGKYEAEVDIIVGTMSVTYEFGLFGQVSKTTNNLGKENTVEGKYEFIEDGAKITLTFPDEDPETYDFSSGEEDGVEYIKLGIIKYTKVK